MISVVGWASGFDGLMEQVVADGDGLASYDQALRPEHAVALQPLACVLYAVEQLPDLTGRHVAVLGQGSIGLLFSHVAKAAGAAQVTGVDPVDRTDIGPAFGVDKTHRDHMLVQHGLLHAFGQAVRRVLGPGGFVELYSS